MKTEKPNNPPAGEAMTMRDYFAAKALQALVHEQHTAEMITVMAMTAYDYADAMLRERSK